MGMDWFARHRVTIDCERNLFSAPEVERLEYRGSNCQEIIQIVTAIRVFRMLRKGCQGYLCAIEVARPQESNLYKIPKAREFLGVFKEVSGLPPDQEIKITIELELV